ncbi:MAG: tRNA preQ1(34) S-adenosylmethionine ribosyltransferase-isomerase QueA [Steroidobacteraceae bacterium]|jgi:S-adenosylmethionine:tRNA ribosyltransferase-isomerase|nr:tRNA preQ1(34) S-adenosylmethionine ribosyltransferase-isomerase QueA [Steroidobacteraceae bacterium]
MRRADFHYELPEELIAQVPPAQRGAGRLLVIDGAGGPLRDLRFADLPSLLAPGDLLVFNNTRVVPARLHGHKATGGAVELLLERILDGRRFLALARASKPFRPGAAIALPGGATATVTGRVEDMVEFQLDRDPVSYFEAHGEVPLPPYIERPAGEDDRERYQTVYARDPGSVAAPTAGLHFDMAMLDRLGAAGVGTAWLTLHVGAGTFQPVRADRLDDHRMHFERARVPAEAVEAVNATRRRGGRVVAVGTTVVRSLESAAREGTLQPFDGETDLFIRPGYRFRVVDAMLTNFHLPESTLLMLVSAFAGRERVLEAYRHAVTERYRFFSYGDACFVTPEPTALVPREAP